MEFVETHTETTIGWFFLLFVLLVQVWIVGRVPLQNISLTLISSHLSCIHLSSSRGLFSNKRRLLCIAIIRYTYS